MDIERERSGPSSKLFWAKSVEKSHIFFVIIFSVVMVQLLRVIATFIRKSSFDFLLQQDCPISADSGEVAGSTTGGLPLNSVAVRVQELYEMGHP